MDSFKTRPRTNRGKKTWLSSSREILRSTTPSDPGGTGVEFRSIANIFQFLSIPPNDRPEPLLSPSQWGRISTIPIPDSNVEKTGVCRRARLGDSAPLYNPGRVPRIFTEHFIIYDLPLVPVVGWECWGLIVARRHLGITVLIFIE